MKILERDKKFVGVIEEEAEKVQIKQEFKVVKTGKNKERKGGEDRMKRKEQEVDEQREV